MCQHGSDEQRGFGAMNTVVDLDAQRPHTSGPASCLICCHEWVAVVPVTTSLLECPACHNMRGVMFSAREVRLIRALEQVATGHALGENSRINWDIAKSIARDALKNEGWSG